MLKALGVSLFSGSVFVLSALLAFVSNLKIGHSLLEQTTEDPNDKSSIAEWYLRILGEIAAEMSLLSNLFEMIHRRSLYSVQWLLDKIDRKITIIKTVNYKNFIAFCITSFIWNSLFLLISALLWSSLAKDVFSLVNDNMMEISLSLDFGIPFIIDNIETLLGIFQTPKWGLRLFLQVLLGIGFLSGYVCGANEVHELNIDKLENANEDKKFFLLSIIRSFAFQPVIAAILIMTILQIIIKCFFSTSIIDAIVLAFALFNIEVSATTVAATVAPVVIAEAPGFVARVYNTIKPEPTDWNNEGEDDDDDDWNSVNDDNYFEYSFEFTEPDEHSNKEIRDTYNKQRKKSKK